MSSMAGLYDVGSSHTHPLDAPPELYFNFLYKIVCIFFIYAVRRVEPQANACRYGVGGSKGTLVPLDPIFWAHKRIGTARIALFWARKRIGLVRIARKK